MCAWRSVSSSASLAYASPSHWTSFASRSFIVLSAISVLLLCQSVGSVEACAGALSGQLTRDGRQYRLAPFVGALVELDRRELSRSGVRQMVDDVLRVQARVAVPRFIDRDGRARAVLGAWL